MKQLAWKLKLDCRSPLSLLSAFLIWLPLISFCVQMESFFPAGANPSAASPLPTLGWWGTPRSAKIGGAGSNTIKKKAAYNTLYWWELWRGGDVVTCQLMFVLNSIVAVLKVPWADSCRNFGSKIPSSGIPNTFCGGVLRSELRALNSCRRFLCPQELFLWN